MAFSIDEMITVKDYVDSLKLTGYIQSQSTMITASDYAKSLQEASSLRELSPLITVREYVKALDNVRYSTNSDKEIEEKIEAYLNRNKKSERNAKNLEKLLA